jgi:hypothetical protein
MTATLAQTQQAFTAALRDPQAAAPAGIDAAALQLYRQLIYNNIDRSLARSFPVLRAVSSDELWRARLLRFFAGHRCANPQLQRLPEDFIAWLDESAGERSGDPGWLAELCHYEWVELALGSDTAQPRFGAPFSLDRPPQLSPLAWTLSYHYPVHRIGPDYQPQAAPAEPTLLIVYRNRADEVRFMEINALTLLLIRAIESQPELSARALLHTLADELQNADADAVVEAGTQLLQGLFQRDVLLGSRGRG